MKKLDQNAQTIKNDSKNAELDEMKDELQKIEWKMDSESKQIGQYICFKATATVPSEELNWFNFSWNDLAEENAEGENAEIKMTKSLFLTFSNYFF